MHVWDGSGTGQIHFSAESLHAETLGHIVENRVVQDALLDRLHDCDLGLLANARRTATLGLVDNLTHATSLDNASMD